MRFYFPYIYIFSFAICFIHVDADPQGDLTTALGWTDADNEVPKLRLSVEAKGTV